MRCRGLRKENTLLRQILYFQHIRRHHALSSLGEETQWCRTCDINFTLDPVDMLLEKLTKQEFAECFALKK